MLLTPRLSAIGCRLYNNYVAVVVAKLKVSSFSVPVCEVLCFEKLSLIRYITLSNPSIILYLRIFEGITILSRLI